MSMPTTPPANSRYSRRRLITILVVGASAVFILGFIIAVILGMPLVDRVAFLFCLGIVNLLGCTFLAAYLTRHDPPEEEEYEDEGDGEEST